MRRRKQQRKSHFSAWALSILLVVAIGFVGAFFPFFGATTAHVYKTLMPSSVEAKPESAKETHQLKMAGGSLLNFRRDILSIVDTTPPAVGRWANLSLEKDSLNGKQKSEATIEKAPQKEPQSLNLDKHTLSFKALEHSQSSGIYNSVFTSLNEHLGQETLKRKVVPLNPGESIVFSPANFNKDMSPNWLASTRIKVIVFGATPDRLDAPGHIKILPVYIPDDAKGVELDEEEEEEKRIKAEKRARARLRAGIQKKEKRLVYTVPEDPALHLTVSHEPTVTELDLSNWIFKSKDKKKRPDQIKITWSSKSSGTLVILGESSEPLVEAQPGFLFATLDRLDWEKPELPNTLQSMTNRQVILNGKTGEEDPAEEVIALHEVWPFSSKSEDTHAAYTKEPMNTESEAGFLPFLAKQFPASVRVDIKPAEFASEEGANKQDSAFNSLAYAQNNLTLYTDDKRQISNESLAHLASLVSTGHFVHLHFALDAQSPSGVSFQTLLNRMKSWQWSQMRAASVFATEADLEELSKLEVFHRIDATIEHLVGTFSNDTFSNVAVHVARQPNPLKREIVKLTQDVPLNYAPGVALLALNTSSPAPISSPVTQVQLMQWLATELSLEKVEPEKPSKNTRTSRAAQRKANQKKKATEVQEEVLPDTSQLVATVVGDEGQLFVFEKGWTFVPPISGPTAHKPPVFGVELQEIADAKKRIFQQATASQLVRLDIEIPSGKMKQAAVANRKNDFEIDLRTEHLVSGCSSSSDEISVRTADLLGEGWMRIIVRVDWDPNEESNFQLSCLIDRKIDNPVAKIKQRVARKAARRAAAAGYKTPKSNKPEVSMSLRLSSSQRKVAMNEIMFGPYYETANTLSSNTQVIHLNFPESYKRMLSLVPFQDSIRKEKLRRLGRNAEDKPIHVWTTPADRFPSDHPFKVNFSEKIEQFVEARLEYADLLKERKL